RAVDAMRSQCIARSGYGPRRSGLVPQRSARLSGARPGAIVSLLEDVPMWLDRSITRRAAMRLLIASSALAALPSRRAWAESAYDGPFVDAHAHLNWDAGVGIDDLMALYDGAGVQGALLFGYPWQLGTGARDRYPDRVVLFLAEAYANAVHPDSS